MTCPPMSKRKPSGVTSVQAKPPASSACRVIHLLSIRYQGNCCDARSALRITQNPAQTATSTAGVHRSETRLIAKQTNTQKSLMTPDTRDPCQTRKARRAMAREYLSRPEYESSCMLIRALSWHDLNPQNAVPGAETRPSSTHTVQDK